MIVSPALLERVVQLDDIALHLIPSMFKDVNTNIIFRHGRLEEVQQLIREHGTPDKTMMLLRGIDRNGECVWELAW